MNTKTTETTTTCFVCGHTETTTFHRGEGFQEGFRFFRCEGCGCFCTAFAEFEQEEQE